MYTRPQMQMPERELLSFLHGYPFATVITADLQATHIPLLAELVAGNQLRLWGHFARANTHWHGIDGQCALAVFLGPHAYIDSRWLDAPAVPTWNYASVHARGTVHLTDAQQTLQALARLKQHLRSPSGDAAQQAFEVRLADAVQGFHLDVSNWQGALKLSQNKRPHERQRIIAELTGSEDPNDQALARLMNQFAARGD